MTVWESMLQLINKGILVSESEILILGITFKENCPDVRNTKVIDIVNEFKTYSTNLTIVDPWANGKEVQREYNILTQTKLPENKLYDAIVLAVGHKEFLEFDILSLLKEKSVVFDVKGILEKNLVDGRL